MSNIKNAPPGEYFIEKGYTMSFPWKVIGTSPSGKTITLQGVKVAPDPEWQKKMKVISGGFAGHCVNQNEQTWLYDGLDDELIKIRKTKNGWVRYGAKFTEAAAPYYFYDYNF